jgi:hypothetical protein
VLLVISFMAVSPSMNQKDRHACLFLGLFDLKFGICSLNIYQIKAISSRIVQPDFVPNSVQVSQRSNLEPTFEVLKKHN